MKTPAQESNTALGTVSNVKSFLLARDWIDKSTTEFRLQNIRELFYTWAKDYHQKEARKLQFYSLDTVPEIEQSAAEWSKTHDNGAILGGFSAAARYAPTVRYQKAEIYVEPQFVQEFVKDLELQPVNTGGNVVITIPHDETPCMYAKPVHDTLVTSPAQTVIDLLWGMPEEGKRLRRQSCAENTRRGQRMKEELKKATDYSEGQKTAAYMVLGEIVNLLNEFSDNIRIIGGWVPTLLYPTGDHIGSIDVDVLLNQLEIKKAESYRTIKRILTQNGYRRHEEKYFTFIKTIVLDGVSYDVDVDFLSGKYGGDGGNVSKHVDGIKTLPATGGNFAFDFPPTDVKIEYMREDGAKDSGHVKVISVVPYLVMKTAALGRENRRMRMIYITWLTNMREA